MAATLLLSAAHALQFRLEEHPDRKLGKGVEQALLNVRACLYDMQNDNPTIGDQIEELAKAIQNGRIFLDLPPMVGTFKNESVNHD